MGPGGREGDVGVGRADHQVDLVEDGGHALVVLGALVLDAGRGPEVEQLLGQLQARSGSGGVRSSAHSGQRSPSCSRMRPRPPRAHSQRSLGGHDLDVDPAQTGVGDEQRGVLGHQVGDGLGDRGRAEVDRHRHLEAPQVAGAQLGLVVRHMGQRERVAGVPAGHHVEVAGDVAHRPAQAARHRGQVVHRHPRALGDAPVGRLQPGQPAEAGRDAGRAAAVAGGRHRDLAAGHGGRRATRRPAGRVRRCSTGCR